MVFQRHRKSLDLEYEYNKDKGRFGGNDVVLYMVDFYSQRLRLRTVISVER